MRRGGAALRVAALMAATVVTVGPFLWLLGTSLAAAAARVAGLRSRQERLLAATALSGVAVAGAGLVAALAGLGPFLEPRLTFVNPNHLAGFLNLTSFVALGFALSSRGQARLLWLLGFAASGSGVFLSLSRGGIAAFFVGAAVLAALHVRHLRLDAGGDRPWRYAMVPVTVSVALAVTAYLALDPVLSEMRTVKGAASELKLALWPMALSMLGRFPLFGIGRGAFETASAAWKVEPVAVTFTHVENEWLQAPLDLGIPAGLVLVGAIVDASLNVDPTDDCTFWYVNEYYTLEGQLSSLAGSQTRIASFKLDGCSPSAR